MLLIFGTRRTVTQLALVVLTCANCHRSAANAILRAVTRFSLFFIPLFPIRTRWATQCTACGFLVWIDKGQAEQLATAPPAPAPGPPPPGRYHPSPQQGAIPGMPGAAPWPTPQQGGSNGNGHATHN